MNRFRKTKKGRDNGEAEAVPPSSFMGMSSKPKKTGKDSKPDLSLDLDSALPSADNFRTSLLMPNLSARFSMLREQDDPSSKLGKANDDSVLFPKRASRLNLFGHNPNPLSDIAEVSSIAGRSSFTTQRVNSYASVEDGTDDDWQQGSIMNRRRPGEGNNLFGGRQKVYKIPVGGKDVPGGGMRGRTVYEDDVNLSTFQKLKLKERQERREAEAERDDVPLDVMTPESDDGLPAFLSKRMTSSSTTSGQSNPRTSTAATSIDEQSIHSNQNAPISYNSQTGAKSNGGVPGGNTGHVSKTRRLYGQGLAQAAQDQQSSALTRLESLSRQRAGAGTPDLPRLNRAFSRSATNLHERRQGISPGLPTPSSAHRNYSPVTSTGSPLSEALDAKANRTSDSSSTASPGYGVVPPLSPPISDNEDMTALAAALHPEDRGKATAMGLFNKPTGPYDEQQFMRRQLQMHENRTQSPANSISRPDHSNYRPRGMSNTSYRSKAESASSYYSGDGPGSRAHSIRDVSPPRAHNNNGTFFLSIDSDNESQNDEMQPLKKVSSVKSQAFDGVHPAFRSRPVSRDSDGAASTQESVEPSELKVSEALNPIQETNQTPPSPILEEASEKAIDSPTLGPAGLGLNSMIRAHLRQDSSQSLAPLPSPRLPTHPDLSSKFGDHDSNIQPYANNVHQNTPPAPMDAPSHPPPPPPSGFSSVALRAKQLREQAAALRDNQTPTEEPKQPQNFSEDPRLGHYRESSIETQKEREEFAHELAERRRRVQESLNRMGSRSNSPAAGRQTPDTAGPRTGGGFSILKGRSGKTSPQDVALTTPPPSSKALKKLGIAGSMMNVSTPSLDSWREDELAQGLGGLGKHSNSSSPQIVSGRNPGRSPYSRSTSYGSQEDAPGQASSRSASPAGASRDRSTSASARSKSRPRPREDLDMVAEHSVSRYNDGTQASSRPGRSPSIPTPARTSMDEHASNDRSASVMSGRISANSRGATPSHLELIPPQNESGSLGMSPRPSPDVPPYSANATPPLEDVSGRDSPMNPYRPDFTNAAAQPAQWSPAGNGVVKRQVSKSQISEPTFVSSTSNVPMVNLPPGACLSNGMYTPPIPPMNPRRRRTTTTQTILGAIKGDRAQTPPSGRSSEDERHGYIPNNHNHNTNNSAMDSRQTLRKMSSEGGHMNSRARQQAMMADAPPAMPAYAPASVQGGMI